MDAPREGRLSRMYWNAACESSSLTPRCAACRDAVDADCGRPLEGLESWKAAICGMHYEEFPRNPLISAPSGMCKAISLTIVHTVIHVTYKGDILLIRVKYSP